GSSGRSSPGPRARRPSPPASPRGSRRWRTCRSAPGGDTRRSARRTSGGGRDRGTAAGARPPRAPPPPRPECPRRRRSRAAGLLPREAPGSTRARLSDEDRHGVALGLVDGLDDVARVLAVDLQRERPVAANDKAVEIPPFERLVRFRRRSTHATEEQAGDVT